MYEALAGLPLSPYRSAHKAKRAMTTAELFKVGQWDQHSLRKALRHIEGDDETKDLTKKLLHPNPELRAQSMREALEHPYFGLGPLVDSSVFVKKSSAQKSKPVVLKLYTDECMAKTGITDEDIIQLMMQKETIPVAFGDPIEEDQEDEGPEPAAEVNEPQAQETPTKIDEDRAAERSPPNPGFDDFVAFLGSSSKPTEETAAGDSSNITEADRLMLLASVSVLTPVKVSSVPETPPVKVVPPKPSSVPAQKTVQPQATAPPLPTMLTPQPTPQVTKSKSGRFSMSGLKSKLGKK